MLFDAFAAITIVIAAGALYLGVRLLGKFQWFVAWIKGTAGFCLIAFAALMVLTGLDLFSYQAMSADKPILTLSFEKKEDQQFEATLVHIENGIEQKFEVFGEQWQIDARIIRWSGLFEILGGKPGYRLDRLNGRYYSLEDERRKSRSVHQLSSSEYWIDAWKVVYDGGHYIPLIDAVYGSATYLPMEDGAIYQVSLTHSGLAARPLNTIAEGAITRWQ